MLLFPFNEVVSYETSRLKDKSFELFASEGGEIRSIEETNRRSVTNVTRIRRKEIDSVTNVFIAVAGRTQRTRSFGSSSRSCTSVSTRRRRKFFLRFGNDERNPVADGNSNVYVAPRCALVNRSLSHGHGTPKRLRSRYVNRTTNERNRKRIRR